MFDWGSFYLASYILRWHYLIALLLSFSLGTAVNYTTNKVITFQNYYKNIPLQFVVFLSGAGTALVLTGLQMYVLVEYFSSPKMAARIITTGIMLFFNFFYHRFLTFGKLQ